MSDEKEFAARLCPHRGIGKDNTLFSIQNGLQLKPFLLEFDIQYYDNVLHLGHPPVINKEETLIQALRLFTQFQTMPKIDMKLEHDTIEASMKLLSRELSGWAQRNVLVNIAGELHNADKYMKAELELMKNTNEYTLLNVDLGRYGAKSSYEITDHINKLARKPFSISPNLDDNLDEVIRFATDHHIHHIHFWSYQDSVHTTEKLYANMRTVLSSGLEVYFDIKTQNIIDYKLT